MLTNNNKKIYDKTQPFYTILGSLHTYNIYCNNGDVCPITIPIASKLQGFPENYFNTMKGYQNTCKMIGNAVPIQVGYVIALMFVNKPIGHTLTTYIFMFTCIFIDDY